MPPEEEVIRAVEKQIDIAEGRKDDFRRKFMNHNGTLATGSNSVR